MNKQAKRTPTNERGTGRRKTSGKAQKAAKSTAKRGPADGKVKTRVRGKSNKAYLSGGNPRIAMADGDAPVQAYIAKMPGWKRALGIRLDALIVRTLPGVRKAVKWNSPFYGIESQGWFLALHTFTHYVKIAFFRGSSLLPVPPGASKNEDTRYLDIHEGEELDEAQMANWVKQAAALPGFLGPSR